MPSSGSCESAEYRKPALLTAAMVFFFFFTAMSVIILPAILLTNGSVYTNNGATVTREEFLSQTHFLFVMSFLALYTGSMAYALYQQRPRSRPLLAAYFPLTCVLGIIAIRSADRASTYPGVEDETVLLAVEFGVLSAVALWYLNRKRAVVSYYRAIQPSKPSTSP